MKRRRRMVAGDEGGLHVATAATQRYGSHTQRTELFASPTVCVQDAPLAVWRAAALCSGIVGRPEGPVWQECWI
jgi:hypothetical protein